MNEHLGATSSNFTSPVNLNPDFLEASGTRVVPTLSLIHIWEDMGVMDAVLRTDGKGLPFLHIKAGGSVCAPSYYTPVSYTHLLCSLNQAFDLYLCHFFTTFVKVRV